MVGVVDLDFPTLVLESTDFLFEDFIDLATPVKPIDIVGAHANWHKQCSEIV